MAAPLERGKQLERMPGPHKGIAGRKKLMEGNEPIRTLAGSVTESVENQKGILLRGDMGSWVAG
jgi:hypothetical protein